MQNSTITHDAIIENFREKLSTLNKKSGEYLENRDFKDFEEDLQKITNDLYGDLAKSIITEVLEKDTMEAKAKVIGKNHGLSVRKTTVSITLCTGQVIEIPSYYGSRKSKSKRKKKKRGPNGSGRHLILDYWGFIGRASPGMYSKLTLMTVICPSYEVCKSVLSEFKLKIDCKKIRRIVLAVGEKVGGKIKTKVNLVLNKDENVKGKRVIVSVDGGRTRTRKIKEEINEVENIKHKKFETPWKEPKLLVIQELDEKGNIEKKSLPIYDTVLQDADAIFELLSEYLKKLNIKEVKQVLFIGDGAPWIWKRVKPMFEKLGLKENQFVLAIDYYHAAQQLYKIIEHIPVKNFDKKEDLLTKYHIQNPKNEAVTIKSLNKKELFKEMKTYLWEGEIDKLSKLIMILSKGKLKQIKTLLNYFTKQKELFNYANLRTLNLPCGSGIVESAIRRVINLRFKSPTSFWISENVEPLMFFRGVVLAGRWSIFINNLTKSIL